MLSPRLANHFAGLAPERLPDLPMESPADLPIEWPADLMGLPLGLALDFAPDATRTEADATQTDAREHETTQAEAWTVSRHGREGDGLKLVLAATTEGSHEGSRDGAPILLTAAQRLQLVIALEERVGVPMDGPVRKELLADDTLSARLERDGLAVSLDRSDGEVFFGAPMYHAWLALQERRRDDSATRPGAGRGAR